MGAYSEMDLDMQYGSDNPFASDGETSASEQTPHESAPVAPTRSQSSQADADAKKAKDEAAAKRKGGQATGQKSSRAGAVGPFSCYEFQ